MTASFSSTLDKLNNAEHELHGTLKSAFDRLMVPASDQERSEALATIENAQKRLHGIMYQRRRARAGF